MGKRVDNNDDLVGWGNWHGYRPFQHNIREVIVYLLYDVWGKVAVGPGNHDRADGWWGGTHGNNCCAGEEGYNEDDEMDKEQ